MKLQLTYNEADWSYRTPGGAYACPEWICRFSHGGSINRDGRRYAGHVELRVRKTRFAGAARVLILMVRPSISTDTEYYCHCAVRKPVLTESTTFITLSESLRLELESRLKTQLEVGQTYYVRTKEI